MIDVYGIGALNLDFIYEVGHLRDVKVPGIGLTPGGEVTGSEEMLPVFRRALEKAGVLRKVSPGGSASNTCHALFLMGVPVGIVGVVGQDGPGDTYLQEVKGVDTDCVVRKGSTGLAFIVVSGQRDRSIVVFPGRPGDLFEEEVDRQKLGASRWVHMTSFVSRRCLDTQIRLKDALRGRVSFSVDPGEIYAALGREVLPLIEGAEVLFTSKKEIEALFGCGLDRALAEALGLVRMVVLKEGREGASLFMKGFSRHAGTKAVDGVDNTGAGDVLNGVFLGLYLRGTDPVLALRVATGAATSSVAGYGRDAYPDKRTIEVLYEDMLVHHGKG